MAKTNESGGSGSFGGFVAGVILFLIGLLLLVPLLLVVGIVLIVQNRGIFAGREEKPAPVKGAPQKPPAAPKPPPSVRPAPRPSGAGTYNSYAQDHNHIIGVGLPAERRLEQLEVMKNAGLLDKEEYELRRQKILRDK